MTFCYVATAQSATTTRFAVRCSLTGPDDINLVIGRVHHIELYSIEEEGLVLLQDVPLNGRIASMLPFQPDQTSPGLLMVTTEKYQCVVLAYDQERKRLKPVRYGKLDNPIGRPAEKGQLIRIDPSQKYIIAHLYQGLITLIPVESIRDDKKEKDEEKKSEEKKNKRKKNEEEKGEKKKNEDSDLEHGMQKRISHISIEELQVIDIALVVDDYDSIILLVLHQDIYGNRHIKAYVVDGTLARLEPIGYYVGQLDDDISDLVNVNSKKNGIMVASTSRFAYIEYTIEAFRDLNEDKIIKEIQPVFSEKRTPSNIECIDAIYTNDKHYNYFLVGDHVGNLYWVRLIFDGGMIPKSIDYELLGQTSIPTAIVYLDNRHVYIGSHLGHSQHIYIDDEKDENGSYIRIQEIYTNIAPISDMCTIGRGLQGQDHVITCSGGYHHGSLSIIRSGINLTEYAQLDTPGIMGIWSIRSAQVMSEYVDMLVMSFMTETQIVHINEHGEMTGLETFGDFIFYTPTLYAANMGDRWLIQVTDEQVQLLDLQHGQRCSQWIPPRGKHITLASASQTQVVVTLPGGKLIYLEIEDQQLVEKGQLDLGTEIACLHLSTTTSALPYTATILAVGLWSTQQLYLYQLPHLTLVSQTTLGSDVIPRSVVLACLDGKLYALVGMGDGHLISFHCDPNTLQLSQPSKQALGIRPISLTPLRRDNEEYVFSASDRPAIIHSERHRISFSAVDLRQTNHICAFHTAAYPNCQVFVTEEHMLIGMIGRVRCLNIQNVPLGRMPRRICYSEALDVLGVLLVSTESISSEALVVEDMPERSEELVTERCSLCIVDANTFDKIAEYELEPYELAESIVLAPFTQKFREYLVVSTSVTFDQVSIRPPIQGRIYVFDLEDRKELRLITKLDAKDSILQVKPFYDKLLVCLGNRLCVYELQRTDDGMALQLICEQSLHIQIIRCEVRGDFIVVGDLLRSITLLSYTHQPPELRVVAQDYSTHWTTALTMLNDQAVLAADGCFNLYTVLHRSDETDEDLRQQMQTCGEFHLGDQVNRFCSGSLTIHTFSQRHPTTRLFGTLGGMLGVVLSLDADTYHIFKQVIRNMEIIFPNAGILDHAYWRKFQDERKEEAAFGIIDGDYLQCFLELSPDERQQVVEGRLSDKPSSSTLQQDGDLDHILPPDLQPVPLSADRLAEMIEELSHFH